MRQFAKDLLPRRKENENCTDRERWTLLLQYVERVGKYVRKKGRKVRYEEGEREESAMRIKTYFLLFNTFLACSRAQTLVCDPPFACFLPLTKSGRVKHPNELAKTRGLRAFDLFPPSQSRMSVGATAERQRQDLPSAPLHGAIMQIIYNFATRMYATHECDSTRYDHSHFVK